MARIRTLKPEFWEDSKLGKLSPIDRLVFLGLISQADDKGRLADNIRRIDGLLFPLTDDTSRESLDILARLSRICRYTSASGDPLIQIVNWTKHQKVDKPAKYTLPGPSPEDLGAMDVTRSSRDPRESVARPSRSDLRPTTPDQGSTNPDQRAKPSSRSVTKYSEMFERWWKEYQPRPGGNRGSKVKAWKKWKADGLDSNVDEQVEILGRFKRSQSWVDGFSPVATTYLNGRLYDDPPSNGTARPLGSGLPPSHPCHDMADDTPPRSVEIGDEVVQYRVHAGIPYAKTGEGQWKTMPIAIAQAVAAKLKS